MFDQKGYSLKALIRNEKGQTMIIVLVLFIVGCLILVPLIYLMTTGYTTSKEVYSKKNYELYTADAGVKRAIMEIETISLDKTLENLALPVEAGQSVLLKNLTSEELTLNGKPVSVTITCISDPIDNPTNSDSKILTYEIKSESDSSLTYAKVQLTTAATAQEGNDPEGNDPEENDPEDDEDEVQYGPLFNNTVTALTGDITIHAGGAYVTGDMFTNGQLKFVGYSSPIQGDVYAAGGIPSTGGSIASGHTVIINEGSPYKLSSPTPVYASKTFVSSLDTMTALKNQAYDLTYYINTPTPSGTPVSSLTLKNNGSSSSPYTLSDPLNVTGNLSLTNSNYVIFDDDVCVGGDLTISGNANITFNAGVKIDGQLKMTSGGGTVTFNDTLSAGSITYTNGMTLNINDNLKVIGDVTFGSAGNLDLKGTVFTGGNLILSGGRYITSYKAMYIDGDLSLGNGAYIKKSGNTTSVIDKVIVVNGSMTASGGTSFGDIDEYPLIINLTNTTINLNSGANLSAALYAPYATATLTGNAGFTGAIIAASINLGTGSGSPHITNVSGLFTDITGGSEQVNGGGDGEGGGDDDGGNDEGDESGSPAVEAKINVISWDIR